MSNVFQFPHRSRVPQKARTTDALLDELAAVEIELARARLAQIRIEMRQAQALWGWWCFKRAVIWGLVLWVLVTIAGAAQAQSSSSKTFYDQQGRFAGSSITRGNSSTYFDSQGRFNGSSVQYGNRTQFYNYQGHFSGSTINTSERQKVRQ